MKIYRKKSGDTKKSLVDLIQTSFINTVTYMQFGSLSDDVISDTSGVCGVSA